MPDIIAEVPQECHDMQIERRKACQKVPLSEALARRYARTRITSRNRDVKTNSKTFPNL